MDKLLLMFALSTLFLSCSTEKTNITGIVRNASDGEPKPNIRVFVYENKKPIYGLWRYPLIDSSKSDSKGIFKFQIKQEGYYSFDFFKNHDYIYRKDSVKINELNDSLRLYFEW